MRADYRNEIATFDLNRALLLPFFCCNLHQQLTEEFELTFPPTLQLLPHNTDSAVGLKVNKLKSL